MTVLVEGDFTTPRTSHRFRVVSPEGIEIVAGYAHGTIVAVWQANPPSVFFTFDLDLSSP